MLKAPKLGSQKDSSCKSERAIREEILDMLLDSENRFSRGGSCKKERASRARQVFIFSRS